jgi:hypothetical protein
VALSLVAMLNKVTAFKAGREVNMSEILKHERMPVPIAIAETNGSLKSGNKSLLLEILLKNGDPLTQADL